MKYDFETLVNRRDQGAAKWVFMRETNPDLAEDTVPFSVADMEFKNPPQIVEGLKKYLDETILGYAMGYKEYYDAITAWQKNRFNWEIKKEWIVNAAGVVGALYNSVRAFSNENDGVIIFSPVYYPFRMAIENCDRKVADCPLIRDDEGYKIDFDLLEKLAKDENNKMLIFCSPHNPVGRVWTKEELKRLSDIIIENELITVSDEIWQDLVMPGYEHTVLATVDPRLKDYLITSTAPSKTFNVAGLATSNIIIESDELREKYNLTNEKFRGGMVNVLGYKACEIAYSQCEDWLVEAIDVIDKNQNMVKEYFEKNFPKVKAPLIQGTYLQWIDFNCLGMTPEELEKFMIFDAEFITGQGYAFGEGGKGFIRLNLAVPTKVLEEGLDKLGQALKSVYK